MAQIDAQSPWRELGDVPYWQWSQTIMAAGGPAGLASMDAWQAARPHSLLALAQLRLESSYGTDWRANKPGSHNPLNLKIPYTDRYVQYTSWPAGIAGWRERVTSPTYKGGIYARTRTISELIHTFAPPYDQTRTTTGNYIASAIVLMNLWRKTAPAAEPPMSLTFGKVPHPPFTRAIASKPAHTGSGNGYDFVPGGRAALGLVGMCWHEWMGTGNRDFAIGFFACPGGARCRNALVDYVIMPNGEIIMLNDPKGNRAPWASGGGVGEPGGLEGDGPAFVARFGTGAINARLVSVEIFKQDWEDYTPAQIASAAALAAHYHDADGQRWDEHPYTSKYTLVTSFLHYEFGTTSCGKGEVDDLTKVQAETKRIMRRYQEGIPSTQPIPPDVPPLPSVVIPGGLTLEEARRRFGEATRHRNGEVTTGHGFDPEGAISLAWAHRAAVEGTWPQVEDWYVLEDSGEVLQLVTFSNNWRLMQAAERAGWQWVEVTPSLERAGP